MERRASRKFPSGIWCTQCLSKVLPTERAVVTHFKAYHSRSPTKEEIEIVLANSSNTMFKRSKRRVKSAPSGKYPERDLEHENRWRNIIQAGAPSLGKRR
jgi:hypothetical protein